MPARHIIAGTRELSPLYQGDLSCLCGLYSILNAAQLALYPELTKAGLRGLFLRGINHLAQTRRLRRVLGVGMDDDLWLPLARDLVAHINDTMPKPLTLRRLIAAKDARSRRSSLEAVRKAIRRGNPVLTYLGGALDHYTVICGYTETRLRLFDSAGVRWLVTDGVGFGEQSWRRHWMLARTVLELSAS